MIHEANKPDPVQIALLGELPIKQRYYLDAGAKAVGGKVLPLNSTEALVRFTRQAGDSAILVAVLKDNVQSIITVLSRMRKAGSIVPVVLVTNIASDAVYLPLMRELGIRQVIRNLLDIAQLTGALRAAVAEDRSALSTELPPLTEEEQGVNLEELANDLNGRIRCGAGHRQVFLHSYVEGIGHKTTPRITLKCPIRTELGLFPYVHYQHIRDVCCRATSTCPALRAYAAMRGQEISAFLPAGETT